MFKWAIFLWAACSVAKIDSSQKSKCQTSVLVFECSIMCRNVSSLNSSRNNCMLFFDLTIFFVSHLLLSFFAFTFSSIFFDTFHVLLDNSRMWVCCILFLRKSYLIKASFKNSKSYWLTKSRNKYNLLLKSWLFRFYKQLLFNDKLAYIKNIYNTYLFQVP